MKITVIEQPGAGKELIVRCESVDAEIRELLRRLSPLFVGITLLGFCLWLFKRQDLKAV